MHARLGVRIKKNKSTRGEREEEEDIKLKKKEKREQVIEDKEATKGEEEEEEEEAIVLGISNRVFGGKLVSLKRQSVIALL